ncbi:protein FAM13B isoform X1 [Lingula anatina]|uniref:Protein FAM13B isoform X1 n=2 Tax=Lingula anatina TaxID=7574 RepID=A0A1S3HZX8_LINAN|nr:protein FAM13B isoform X1 [Lingula anatina]|eukprot:XP_013391568.1 protein FAM13B isoform X1 [Lingula anatina]
MPHSFVCGSSSKVADSVIAKQLLQEQSLRITSSQQSRMDKMKKLLSSPLSKRKTTNGSPNKTFGLPLEDLITKDQEIPFVVRKICEFIRMHGIGHEGIFRVNGNARVVEKLKASFDKTGDADLLEAGDVMAVAGLLKLFLRELPDAVIPESETQKYVEIHEEYGDKDELCTQKLKQQIKSLPKINYAQLKYLCRFLVHVAQRENSNKMSAMALGIVFGPNLFRCSDGIAGLKEQGVTNQIVCKFINQFEQLFDDKIYSSEEELKPAPAKSQRIQVQEAKQPRTPPPRPPPPKFEIDSSNVSAPVPSPRRSKMKQDGGAYLDSEEVEGSDESRGTTPRSRSMLSPRFSDDEFLDPRATSPFHLESETGSTMASPVIDVVASEVVKNVISEVTQDYLFGSDISSDDDSDHKPVTPTPAPRKKRKDRTKEAQVREESSSPNRYIDHDDEEEEDEDDEGLLSPRSGVSLEGDTNAKPKRHRSTSAATEMFQEDGVEHSQGYPGRRTGKSESITIPSDLNDPVGHSDSPHVQPVPKPRSPRKNIDRSRQKDGFSTGEEGYGTLSSEVSTLSNFRRAPGPKRRTPTRKMRTLLSPDHFDGHVDLENIDEERMESPDFDLPALTRNNTQIEEDVNHNEKKPTIRFLDIHDERNKIPSPERSPNSSRKQPFVPPLDLSTLHENVEGGGPILAEKGPSISFQKAKSMKEEEPLLSPRSQKMKKKSSMRSDDEHTLAVKKLTKHIQSLKKKIKHFEETFEAEHGYRPSQQDKSSKPEIKRYMNDLAKSRKELKLLVSEDQANQHSSLKEDSHMDQLAETYPGGRPDSGHHPTGHDADGPTMQQTLDILMKKLSDKRRDANRPEALEMMNREQVQDEKLAVQKVLLQFENFHGRPVTKPEKELMRPLYDRYRNIKRTLAKPISPSEKDLPSVPEGHTMDFSPGEKTVSQPLPKEPVHIHLPAAEMDDQDEFGSGEFSVTKNMSLLQDTTMLGVKGKVKESNLHELSMEELLAEQSKTRTEKKRLRKFLREFEDDFLKENGRKVQKEDRLPMSTEYNDYKQIKARLKLLDALISKHDPSSTI